MSAESLIYIRSMIDRGQAARWPSKNFGADHQHVNATPSEGEEQHNFGTLRSSSPCTRRFVFRAAAAPPAHPCANCPRTYVLTHAVCVRDYAGGTKERRAAVRTQTYQQNFKKRAPSMNDSDQTNTAPECNADSSPQCRATAVAEPCSCGNVRSASVSTSRHRLQ
jgi:hypothetical protein